MIDVTDNERLIARYLNGELSKEDETDIQRWISENPKKQTIFSGN